MNPELAVTSAVDATGRLGGPLSLVDLAALLRAAASLCNSSEGRDHNVLTATYTVRDRVERRTGFPELAAVTLDDNARVQAAAALCWAVYGRVPNDNPVAAAVRWQSTIRPASSAAAMLGQMLDTAAKLVSLAAVNERAAALLGVDLAALDGATAERA
jgi:hypothetical protein